MLKYHKRNDNDNFWFFFRFFFADLDSFEEYVEKQNIIVENHRKGYIWE